MTTARPKGSRFNFSDQGVFYSFLDMYPESKSASAATNRTNIIIALGVIATNGGGVLLVPQGVSHNFNPDVDFPVSANGLMLWEMNGTNFQLHGNQTIHAHLGDIIDPIKIKQPHTVSLRLVDDISPITYEFKLEVYNNGTTPVITGSSYDVCVFLPGGVTPVEAIARAGATPGRHFFFAGIDTTSIKCSGTAEFAGSILRSKSIQAPLTGTSIQIADGVERLILDHAATIAALTVTLPQNPQDGNTVEIFSRSIVTALTLAAGTGETIATGHTVTTIAALGSLVYTYNSSDLKWYRVR